MDIKNIHARLERLLKNSYSPYSKFKVACIVEDENENLYEGVNVENASYGATICAERSAISNAISHGAKKIKSLYLMTSSRNFVTPCGICLQTICEFMSPLGNIILFDIDSRYKIWRLENLLPQFFSKRDISNE